MSSIAIDGSLGFGRPLEVRRASQRAGAPGGLRLTRRGRAVVAGLALALGAGLVLSAQGAAADSPIAAVPVAPHTVVDGDTLWSIAGTVARPGEDRRDVVDELTRLNGLDDVSLRVGQVILVPER
ncbi:LysM peptidoglycan-binding domain-containing protein [Cellulomonas sp. APG4]|uniref:LysM peptidoglycan-binding domain-containing protein n=1 Tax=Cellulomonas sp. APG4 TaxID=1538656 RepID=UPI0013794BBA|nr:LysM peptidoglycan-binding domain-containing protein [Cellulomonas sp. APG4]NCT92059.1 LysM peptidoglycan-binding domain-containing protein [Cellulomonas sp. APG4]